MKNLSQKSQISCCNYFRILLLVFLFQGLTTLTFAQTTAQDIFGIGLELGMSEYSALSDNNINLIDQYLSSAQSRARDNECVRAQDIQNLRNRLRGITSGRTRADIILEFRNNLYIDLQSCNCVNNGGDTNPSNNCKWRVNIGRIDDRGDHIYTKAPSDGATSYFIACDEYLGNWTSVKSISFEKKVGEEISTGPTQMMLLEILL